MVKKNQEHVLVVGATGQQGGAVLQSLLTQGVHVRILTRNPEKASPFKSKGAEIAKGDLTDRSSLDQALIGIQKAYLVTTPFEKGAQEEVKQGKTFIDAAKAANVEHLVFSSVASADSNTEIPHFESKWQIEQYLQKSGVPLTVIRPVFFMENLKAPWMLQGIQEGKLIFPLNADRKIQMIAVHDIGEFAATALLNPKRYLGKTIEIAGDELTMHDALYLVSQATGQNIRYEQIPDTELERAVGRDFAAMFRWFNKVGYHVDIGALQKKWGIPLTKLREVVYETNWQKKAA